MGKIIANGCRFAQSSVVFSPLTTKDLPCYKSCHRGLVRLRTLTSQEKSSRGFLRWADSYPQPPREASDPINCLLTIDGVQTQNIARGMSVLRRA